VAREEFERIIDTRHSPETFDTVWATVVDMFQSANSEVYFALSEMEYRQALASFFYLANASYLQKAALASQERADVAKKSLIFTCLDKLKLPAGSPIEPDLLHGVLRKPDPSHLQKTCFLHPNGCPPNGDPVVDLLGAILGVKPR
jgi:hypothetical protein